MLSFPGFMLIIGLPCLSYPFRYIFPSLFNSTLTSSAVIKWGLYVLLHSNECHHLPSLFSDPNYVHEGIYRDTCLWATYLLSYIWFQVSVFLGIHRESSTLPLHESIENFINGLHEKPVRCSRILYNVFSSALISLSSSFFSFFSFLDFFFFFFFFEFLS